MSEYLAIVQGHYSEVVIDTATDLEALVLRVTERGYFEGYVTNQDGGRETLESLRERYRIQTEEPEPHYHAGWNMPGYLPEMEPATLEDAESAGEFLRDELSEILGWMEEEDSEGDGLEEIIAELESLDADELRNWSGLSERLAYWISECSERVCMEGLRDE